MLHMDLPLLSAYLISGPLDSYPNKLPSLNRCSFRYRTSIYRPAIFGLGVQTVIFCASRNDLKTTRLNHSFSCSPKTTTTWSTTKSRHFSRFQESCPTLLGTPANTKKIILYNFSTSQATNSHLGRTGGRHG